LLNQNSIVLTEVLNIKNHLRNLFPQLSAENILSLESAGESFIAHKGDLIVKQNEICKGLLVVVNGKACVKLENKDCENIIQFLQAGETFYTHEAYLGLTNRTSCICMETSLIYFLPIEAMKKMISSNPQLMICLMNLASKESELFEQRASNLITLPVKFRFIDSLLTLIKKFGEQKPDHLFIPIKRDEIGSYINASKASLSRVVTELENSKIIKTSRSGIKVFNSEALTEIQA